MSEIKIFSNQNFGEIRTAGTSEEPLFCLADICKVLDLRVDSVQSRISDAPIRIGVMDSKGRIQQMNFVSEKNLYRVIMRSDKPQAEPFQDWVCGEVLPSIRKTGAYSVNKNRNFNATTDEVHIALEWINGVSQMLNLNNSSKLLLLEKVAEPMKLPLPDYTDSKGVLVSATELLKRAGAKLSIRDFNKKMKESGLMSERTRKSSRGEKKFNVLNESCSAFGENQVNPHNPKETQPLYYEGRFSELLQKICAL